jgi:hypothetical protein
MKDDDAKLYGDIRGTLTSLRVDQGKLRVRVSSRKVFLSGELHKTGGTPMKPARLLDLVRESLMKVRGVRMVVVETDLERAIRRG